MHLEKFDFYKLKQNVYEDLKQQYEDLNFDAKREMANQEALALVGGHEIFTYNHNGSYTVGFKKDTVFDFNYKIVHEIKDFMIIRPHQNSKAGKAFSKRLNEVKKQINANLEKFPDFEKYVANSIGLNIDREDLKILGGNRCVFLKSAIFCLFNCLLVKDLKAFESPELKLELLEPITAGNFIDAIDAHNSKVRSEDNEPN